MSARGFFGELRERKVFRAAAIYGAVAWGLTEVIVTIVEQLYLPPWVSTLAVIVFVVGFPIAMFLAWTFDITAAGIERTEIGSRRGKASIAGSLLLLVGGTAGLFLLIRPSIELAEAPSGAVSVAPHSIAVLPFENISRRERDFYLSEGLSDELRDQLGRVERLQIAARSSSVAVRNQSVGAVRMAASLGVAYLVEGSLRRVGQRLSVSVQLIDGNTGLAVWTRNYERGPLELLAVQQAVAREVLTTVLPDAPASQMAAPATLDASANDLLLLARHYEHRVREKPEVDIELQLKAIDLYRQAVAADPEAALAHSRLASALMYIGDFDSAEPVVRRAVELDAKLSDVQTTLGTFLFYTAGVVAAFDALTRGVELNANNVDALSAAGWPTWALRGPASAEPLYQRAVTLDPLSLSRQADLGAFYGISGARDKTLAVIEAIETNFDGVEAYRAIARLYELIGEVDHAIAWAIRAHDAAPGNPEFMTLIAELYAAIGDAGIAAALDPGDNVAALFHLRRYADIIDVGGMLLLDQPNDVSLRYLVAFALNATGRPADALRMLQATGLPGDLAEVRSARDIEATLYLADALAGIGEHELAQGIAAQFGRDLELHADWWAAVYMACARAIEGRDDEALDQLARTRTSLRLPWSPMLHDAPCFAGYADEPLYLAVLDWAAERRAQLRERLPVTLAEYNVALPTLSK